MDVKTAFLNGNLTEEVYRHNLKASYLELAVMYANFKDPFMG